MAQLIKTFLNGSAARHANLLSTANAEAGTGWTNNAPATPIPTQNATNSIASPFNGWDQATASAWAYGCRLAPGAGGTYSITYGGTFGTGVNVVSCFVRTPQSGDTPSSATPAATFTLGVIATDGTAQAHSHRFAYDATQGGWLPSLNGTGGRAAGSVHNYGDGWQRLSVAYQVGWDTAAGDTSTSGDHFNVFLTCQNNKNVDVWGVMLEQLSAVTPPTNSTDLTNLAYRIRPSPYLDGLDSGLFVPGIGPLGFQTQRGRYHKGIYQVKSTVTGTTFSLLQRAHTQAPWESAQATVFGDLNADFTKTYTIEVFPEYRLAITALAATGVQGAWLAT